MRIGKISRRTPRIQLRRRVMKKYAIAFATLILAGAMTAASAIAAGPVARFDNGYLDEHPEVAERMGRDPRLVDNPRFLATHPGIDQYFKNHPEIREELQNHPDRFMAREHYYERRGERNGSRPLATTHRYMDSHPEEAKQLGKKHALIDNSRTIPNQP